MLDFRSDFTSEYFAFLCIYCQPQAHKIFMKKIINYIINTTWHLNLCSVLMHCFVLHVIVFMFFVVEKFGKFDLIWGIARVACGEILPPVPVHT